MFGFFYKFGLSLFLALSTIFNRDSSNKIDFYQKCLVIKGDIDNSDLYNNKSIDKEFAYVFGKSNSLIIAPDILSANYKDILIDFDGKVTLDDNIYIDIIRESEKEANIRFLSSLSFKSQYDEFDKLVSITCNLMIIDLRQTKSNDQVICDRNITILCTDDDSLDNYSGDVLIRKILANVKVVIENSISSYLIKIGQEA